MLFKFFKKVIRILILCGSVYTYGQNCTSTTADIRYIGPAPMSNTGTQYTQSWGLQNITNCVVDSFRIEEFPEVYKQTSGGSWVLDATPITIVNNPAFSLTGNNQTGTATITFNFAPTIGGTYRIFFRIKDQYNTTLNDICTNYPNRCRLYAQITTSGVANLPNLVPTNASIPISSTPGGNIPVSVDVNNIGTGGAGGSRLEIWYSETNSLNPSNSQYLGYKTVSGLNAGNSTTKTASVTLPTGIGTGVKYVCFKADVADWIAESNENDNCICEAITIGTPTYHDLTTSNESFSPAAISQGGSFTASCNAHYTGSGSASSSVGVYLSSNNTLESSDIFVGTFSQMNLSISNTTQNLSKSFNVPTSIPIGSYNILFVSDYGNNVNEGISGEQNNIRSIGHIVVNIQQDITVSNPNINKSFVMPGGVVLASCMHNFNGSLPYNIRSEVGFYLSTTPDSLGIVHHFTSKASWMGATTNHYTFESCSIPNVPNGTYHIVFVGDHNNAFTETNEHNNTIASVPFTISNIPPTLDITISNLSAGATDISRSGTLSVSCNQDYIGPTASSVQSSVGFVLSKDLIYDNNDIFLCSDQRFLSNPPSSTSCNCSGPIPNTIVPDSYYLLAKADYDNMVNNETYENNNTQAYGIQIRVLANDVNDMGADYLRAEHLCTKIGDPVNAATGEFIQEQVDMELHSFGQSFPWKRYYHSQRNYNGSLGHKWTHSYDIHLDVTPDRWTVQYGDGHTEPFVRYHDNSTWPLFWEIKDSLYQNTDSSYTLIKPEGITYRFDVSGNIQSIESETGVKVLFDYTAGKLSRVNLPGGRHYNISYQGNRISTVNDNAGRVITYQYDVVGNLVGYTNTRGGSFSYSYDALNQITAITDPKSIVYVQNVYDSQGRVIEQLDADNNRSTYQYTSTSSSFRTLFTNPLGEVERYTFLKSTHRLVSYRDPVGNWKSFGYAAGGNGLLQTSMNDQESNSYSISYQYQPSHFRYTKPIFFMNPLVERTYIEYGVKNLPITFVNINGDSTKLTYDSLRNPLTITLPNGGQITYTYNSLGQRLSSTDPNGNLTTYTYNTQGDLTGIGTASGNYSFQYDVIGRPIRVTDRNGNSSQVSYDSYGNILSMTDAMGFTVFASYDANGNLDTIIDKNGVATVFEYDNRDRIVKVTNALGHQTQYTYDAANQLVQTTYPNGSTMSYTYNVMGWLTSQTNPLGTWSYTYNKIGDLLTVTDALNNVVSTMTYDPLRRPTSQQDALGNTSNIVYDRPNRQITAIDANGHPTIYQYDVMGQLASVTDANGGQNNMTYDLSGNLLTLIDAKGQAITYGGYNHHHLPTSMAYPGNYTTNYQYDNEGNLIQTTNADGIVANYVLDANYRVTNVNYSNGSQYQYVYDDVGRLLTAINAQGATTFNYDVLGRVLSSSDPWGYSIQYGYDVMGNRTHTIYPTGDSVLMQYNAVGLQTSIRDWLGNYSNHTYNSNGQLSSITNSNGTSTSMTYDAVGRMLRYDNYLGTGGRFYSDSLVYDPVGNITNIISDQHLLPNFAAANIYNHIHAGDDRETSSILGTHTYNNEGTLTSTTGTTNANYTFGERDLLKSYTVAGKTRNNTFDALDHCIQRDLNGTAARYAISDKQSLLYSHIQAFDDNNQVKKSTIYTQSGIGWQVDSANNVNFPIYNYLGHTIALTNLLGDTTDLYAYGPFGDFKNQRGSSSFEHTFLGKYGIFDEGNDHFMIRARSYNAAVGRFLSKDAAAIDGGNTQGVNRYVYGQNQPFGLVDVNGFNSQELAPCPPLGARTYEAGVLGISNYGDLEYGTRKSMLPKFMWNLYSKGLEKDFKDNFLGTGLLNFTDEDDILFNHFKDGSMTKLNFSSDSYIAKQIYNSSRFFSVTSKFERAAVLHFREHGNLTQFNGNNYLETPNFSYSPNIFLFKVMGGSKYISADINAITENTIDVSYKIGDTFGVGHDDIKGLKYLTPGLSEMHELQHYQFIKGNYRPFVWSVDVNRSTDYRFNLFGGEIDLLTYGH